MKKLALIAGLAGILVTGALAQTDSGTRSQTAAVNINVDRYINLGAISGGFAFHVTDGGFAATYASAGAQTFQAISNVAYDLTAAVTGTGVYSVFSKLDGGSFVASATENNNPITPGHTHSVDVQLQGNTSTGLPPTASQVNGTLTVSVAPH